MNEGINEMLLDLEKVGVQKMDSPNKKYGIALPAHQQFVRLIDKLPQNVKKQMKLHVFLVKRVGKNNYTVGYHTY